MFQLVTPRRAYYVRAACGRRIGICGYTAVPEDGRTCLCVCVFVCMVTDFSAEDKASSVKFCTAVHRCPRQGISRFGETLLPRSPKSDESASA